MRRAGRAITELLTRDVHRSSHKEVLHGSIQRPLHHAHAYYTHGRIPICVSCARSNCTFRSAESKRSAMGA